MPSTDKPKKIMPPIIKPKQTHKRQTVKPTPKIKAKTILLPSSKNTNTLITLFTKLLNNDWEEKQKILAFLTSIDDNIPDTGLDPLHILQIFSIK